MFSLCHFNMGYFVSISDKKICCTLTFRILRRSTVGSDYSFDSSINFVHLDFGIFSHSSLQICSSSVKLDGGVSVNSNLEVFPQILNGIQVWALAGPLKDFHILVLKPFQCCFGCMLRVIVLLEHKSSP